MANGDHTISIATQTESRFHQIFPRGRVLFTAIVATLFVGLFSFGWESGPIELIWRAFAIAFGAMVAFGGAEQWPDRLPTWLARWVFQVLAVALSIPLLTFLIYVVTTPAGQPPFWQLEDRLLGFLMFVIPGELFGPWFALGALVRKKDAIARHQALAFDLQRSELERQALDARLRLLQAQVAPHFLFNTLANIRELVASGSDRASDVLDSLIQYLRAAIPSLDGKPHSVTDELASVRAYLELMQMRIPDRLQFTVTSPDQVPTVPCPPMVLLTLVENAVRHGIDPIERGGSIDVQVDLMDQRVVARVTDTGVGLSGQEGGSGTGIAALRERLRLLFGDRAELRIMERHPHGVIAEVHWPSSGGRQ